MLNRDYLSYCIFKEDLKNKNIGKLEKEQLLYSFVIGMPISCFGSNIEQYNHLQLEQIIKAYIHGLDHSILCDTTLNALQMNEIRRFMEDVPDYEYVSLKKLSYSVIYQLRRFAKFNLIHRIAEFAGLNLSWMQLDKCLQFILNGQEDLIYDENGKVLEIEELYRIYLENNIENKVV